MSVTKAPLGFLEVSDRDTAGVVVAAAAWVLSVGATTVLDIEGVRAVVARELSLARSSPSDEDFFAVFAQLDLTE